MAHLACFCACEICTSSTAAGATTGCAGGCCEYASGWLVGGGCTGYPGACPAWGADGAQEGADGGVCGCGDGAGMTLGPGKANDGCVGGCAWCEDVDEEKWSGWEPGPVPAVGWLGPGALVGGGGWMGGCEGPALAGDRLVRE